MVVAEKKVRVQGIIEIIQATLAAIIKAIQLVATIVVQGLPVLVTVKINVFEVVGVAVAVLIVQRQ